MKYRGLTKGSKKEVKGNHLVIDSKHYIHYPKVGFANCECCGGLYLESLAEVTPESLAMETTINDKNNKMIHGSFPVDGVMSRGGDKVKDERGIVHNVEWGGHWEYAAFGLSGKRLPMMGTGPEYYWDELNPLYSKHLEIISRQYEESGE